MPLALVKSRKLMQGAPLSKEEILKRDGLLLQQRTVRELSNLSVTSEREFYKCLVLTQWNIRDDLIGSDISVARDLIDKLVERIELACAVIRTYDSDGLRRTLEEVERHIWKLRLAHAGYDVKLLQGLLDGVSRQYRTINARLALKDPNQLSLEGISPGGK